MTVQLNVIDMVRRWMWIGSLTCCWMVVLSACGGVHNPNLTSWASAGVLGEPLSHTTVIFFNETLVSIGGCTSVDCTNQSSSVNVYSPEVPAPPASLGDEARRIQHDVGIGSDWSASNFPPLSYSLAGRHAAVSFSGLVYVVRSCSMLIQNPVQSSSENPASGRGFFEDSQQQVPSSLESTVADFSVVTEYDPSTGTVNDSFFQIPARANASCVNVANWIYVIGGYNISTGLGILEIDAIDIMNVVYISNVSQLESAVSNPEVATDYTSVYITGGRLMASGAINRYVWRFVPSMDVDGGSPCTELLHILPENITEVTRNNDTTATAVDAAELSIIPFAGYLAVVNSQASQLALLPLHYENASQLLWELYPIGDLNDTTSGNYSFMSDDDVSVVPVPDPQAIPGTLLGGSIGFLATVLHNTPKPGPNSTNNSSFVGSQLLMYRVGGVQSTRQWLTENISVIVPQLVRNISVSVAQKVLALPVNNVKHHTIQSGIVSFGLVGGNTSGICKGSTRTTPCKVRLSSRGDCLGSAAGTSDAPWDGTHDVVFTASGASYPVYVCFSFGRSAVDTCSGQTVPSAFFNTDALRPLDLVDSRPTTSTPTPPKTPSPATTIPSTTTSAPTPPPSSGTSLSTLLYIFGAVAAVTTLVALLLVAKLRKVPDEGLLDDRSRINTTVGYGTHQEERYKILGKIGEGAFSIVYLVARRVDGVRFAMKHMECQSDLQRQEAIKECEIMRSLQGHPNVINLYDMFMNYEFDVVHDNPDITNTNNRNSSKPPRNTNRGGNNDEEALLQGLVESPKAQPKRSRHLCLVMEYHPAGDLRRWALQHRGAVSESILCSIAFQVTSVLRHIHAQEPAVIHRDLKPENILIVNPEDERSTVATASKASSPSNAIRPPNFESLHSSKLSFLPIVITDFGLARIQEGTHCASGAGTLPYVAPECFKKKYTVQCDMWSLGCVLYAVATKRCSHDTVRLMFQDCEQPDFKEVIAADLKHCGLSDTFTTFALQLLERDARKRLTAEQAFKMFRRKGDVIFLSQRVSMGRPSAGSPPSTPVSGPSPVERVSSGSPTHSVVVLPPTETVVEAPPSPPLHRQETDNHEAEGPTDGTSRPRMSTLEESQALPDSERSLNDDAEKR